MNADTVRRIVGHSQISTTYSNGCKMIKVPGTENLVIVYDQYKEDPTHPRVSCEIPELGITLHSRCFGCRIDENGVLQSLKHEDGKVLVKYFSR